MGLGKTLQAIAAATWLREQAEIARALIVARPRSSTSGHGRSVASRASRSRSCRRGHGTLEPVPAGRGFCIVNYELVMRDLSLINQHLCPDLVILDEAQRIKNWRTKIASAVKLIPSRYAFVLSALRSRTASKTSTA